jgi:hypothetical protein
MYNNVPKRRSIQLNGAAACIIFAVYVCSLTILAILTVPVFYFIVVAVLGLPATGIFQFLQEELRAKRWADIEKQQAQQVPAEPIRPESATDSAGRPVIHL